MPSENPRELLSYATRPPFRRLYAVVVAGLLLFDLTVDPYPVLNVANALGAGFLPGVLATVFAALGLVVDVVAIALVLVGGVAVLRKVVVDARSGTTTQHS